MTEPSDVERDYTADEVAANRAAWLTALRSGDYRQANGALRVDQPDVGPEYCCLGVAEDVQGATWRSIDRLAFDGVDVNELHVEGSTHVVDDVDGPQGIVLSQVTMRWLGVTVSNPFVVFRDPDEDDAWAVTQLSDLNDDRHLTLAQIADVVTDQPAGWTGDERESLAELNHRAD